MPPKRVELPPVTVNLSRLHKAINRKYYPLLFVAVRFLILYGGAGSGKSVFAAQKILVRCITEPGHKILVVRKVAKTLRESCFSLILSIMGQWKWLGLPGVIVNRSDMRVRFGNGSEILFAGLDDVEKLKSIHGITSIWIEEATELTEEDLLQLNLRLRGDTPSYKQIILSFNPILVTHWLRRVFFEEKMDDCYICHSTYKDNEWIDPEYKRVLEGLAKVNPNLAKIYKDGEWGVLKGLIYPPPDIIDAFPSPDQLDEIIYGLDFGFNNPNALVKIGYRDGTLYIEEMLYRTEMTNKKLIDWMTANLLEEGIEEGQPRGLTGREIYADNAEPARIEEIMDAGFNVHPCIKSSRTDGVLFVMKHPIKVVRGSQNLLKEFNAYVWKEDKDGKQMDEPVKFSDHAMDAMRYGVFSHFFRHLTEEDKTDSFSGFGVFR